MTWDVSSCFCLSDANHGVPAIKTLGRPEASPPSDLEVGVECPPGEFSDSLLENRLEGQCWWNG